MTPERFRQIRNLYEAALEIDPEKRLAFLRDACRGDDDLLDEVERLLMAHERTRGFIETPILGSAAFEPAGESIPKMEGRRIGAYQVLREIGRGGMGAVYLCARADEEFQRQVAIKIVRFPLESEAILRRFRQERQILATLDHPNIARLFDGGTTEEGLPYFVMEYVEGQTIDSWCDERKLNVTERLELFRSVCAAVQYAHQNLVAHLDLKPANILVTTDGTVKLLDFGIARLLHPQGEEARASYTATLLQGMTPEYASPEQVRGMPISTASDVYSLGIVLYELLTGHRPYRMNSRILQDVVRVICEEDPTRPSMIVTEIEETKTPDAVSVVREGTPARLRQRLEGDLDNILLKTLRKDPARRYGSAEQLNEDLRRHLEGLPVSARKDTFSYRLERFVRRNRAGLAAGGLVIATLLAGLTTTLWQAQLALREQRQSVLLPQMVLYAYADIAAFGVAVYFCRPTLRRLLGACAGAAVFVLLFHTLAQVFRSVGWWRFALSDMPPMPVLLPVLGTACWATMLALISWRVTRRFGWTGQVSLIGIMSVEGPLRDRAGAAATGLIVFAPGASPLVAHVMLWALMVIAMQMVMRLVAGPAASDRLARTKPRRSRVPVTYAG
jgi:serine/threonine protein kinase